MGFAALIDPFADEDGLLPVGPAPAIFARKLFPFRVAAAVVMLLGSIGLGAASAKGPAPTGLQTEMLTDPIGLDTATPRFTWRVEDTRTGARQMAYEVQAAGSAEAAAAGTADRWDSGVVASDRSHLVTYGGQPLGSRARVWWRVRTWDELGRASPWSKPARFEVALLAASDWQAKWIAAPRFAPVGGDATALWSRQVVIPTATAPELGKVDAALKRAVQLQWERELEELRPAPLLRKAFVLSGKMRWARLYLCGLGFHEVTLNGHRVDDFMMPPAESHYREYAYYVVRDVADFLQPGDNALGVLLGAGRYDETFTYARKAYGHDLPLLAQLEVETDRGRAVVVSDETWQCAPSPLLKSHFWLSEAFDARREIPGWDRPRYAAAGWMPARLIPAPTKRLVSQLIPPERVMGRVQPVAMTNPHPGVWLFDLGRLIVGCAEVRVRVPSGTAVSLRYGEQAFGRDGATLGSILHYENFDNTARIPGMLSSKTRGNGIFDFGTKDYPRYHALTPADVYVARGARGGETWHARFAYHPFRYVELTGYPGTPSPEVITGLEVHTDLGKTGSFVSSDPVLNGIYDAAVASADDTVHGSVNDNTGTEKENGLTPTIAAGQGSVFFRDDEPLWRKALADLRAVTAEPMVPTLLGSGLRLERWPETRSPIWSRHMVELPWSYRLYFGDQEAMKTHYSYMRAYVDFFTRGFAATGVLPADEFGDHMDFATAYGKPPPIALPGGAPNAGLKEVRYLTDPRLAGAAYVIGMTRLVSAAARMLGRTDESGRYAALAERMSAKFNEVWFIPERNAYGRRSPEPQFTVQGGNSLALYFDLVPTENRPAVLEVLAQDIESWGGISTGMAATYPLLEVLARNGRADLALKVLTQRSYPGPAHSLTFGTGTLPEVWATPSGPAAASLVQSEYVGLARWCYVVLGGIEPDPAAPGFKHFSLEPVMPEGLASVSCRTQTPYGWIVSAWKREAKAIRWSVTVPWNTTATVRLAGVAPDRIAFDSRRVDKSEFEVSSGSWNVVIIP